MLKKWKVRFCGMFAAAVLLTGMCPAQTYAFMENEDYVSIDSGVVDTITVNGVTVEALYQPYGSWINTDTTYSCAAFVKRFYSQVFGRDVYGLKNIYSIPAVDQGEFYATSSPKVGDIIRDNVSVHWAIVKEINGDGRVTVIQQNAWNNPHTKAMVNAKIRLDDSRYTFFRWSGNEGGQENTPAPASYSIEYGDKNVTETNAVLYANVNNPNRVNVNQVGCYLWNERDELIKYHLENCSRPESRFNMWFDINSEFGVALEPGTTYKYQFFVVDNGVEYPGEVQTFTTNGNSVSEPSYSIEYGDKNVTETNAVLYAKVNNPNRVNVNQVGCYLWNERDELIKYHLENCSRPESRFNMWFDINSEFGVTLEPGTTYKYQFFVVDNGVEYPGEVQTFTTNGSRVSESDGQMPSEIDMENAILLMAGLLGQSRENIIEEVGEPIERNDTSFVYDIHTLFLKSGRMTTSFDQEGAVYDVTWTYTYSSGCDENKINSEKFYLGVAETAKKVYKTDLNGFCTNPDNMTSVYDNNIRIERNIVNGVPVITVQVGSEA